MRIRTEIYFKVGNPPTPPVTLHSPAVDIHALQAFRIYGAMDIGNTTVRLMMNKVVSHMYQWRPGAHMHLIRIEL